MRSAERIHDEHVAQRRHAPRELLVVGFLADFETNVLAEHELAVFEGHAVEPVRRERDLAAEHLA